MMCKLYYLKQDYIQTKKEEDYINYANKVLSQTILFMLRYFFFIKALKDKIEK